LNQYIKILFLFIYTFCNLTIVTAAPVLENNNSIVNKTDKYIKFVYDKISFKKINKLSYEAFSKAYYGYLNLKEAGKIHGNAYLTICDFSLSSNTKRMWVIDVARKKVLYNNLVAHGSGSGEEFANKFSNVPESHTSSLGFYTTGETYHGDNGYSLKLHGVDGAFNNKAFERDIVIHGADYVCAAFANCNNRLGRSHGCPALPRELAEPIISKIANGSCLFIYHPNKNYITNSYWLNNKISNLPQEAAYLDLLIPNKLETNKWLNASDSLQKPSYVTSVKPQLSATDPNRIIKKDNKQVSKVEKPIALAVPTEKNPITIPIEKEYIITTDTIYTSCGKPVIIQRKREK
jgi:hypothetical protein